MGIQRICSAAILTLLLLANSASAQNYSFQVTRMQLECYLQPDASVILDYEITFQNNEGAHPIDIVDIGLPQKGYRDVTGSVDSQPISTIRPSEYVSIGVEMHLEGARILPGQSGTVHFRCTIPDMIYADTTDDTYASFQIKPTWYDPQFQMGVTHLQVAIHFPPGVEGEQVRYQQEAHRYDQLVITGEGDQRHVAAIWDEPETVLSENNPKYSVSFPRSVMQRVVTISRFQLATQWLVNRPQVRLVSFVLLAVLLSILFFRFSHGTGCVVFLVLLVGMFVALSVVPALHFFAWPGMLLLIGINEWALRRRRTDSYLPAMATVEGGGIKRGLTAPQAAVLLELPLGKILALVIFGLLKKKVLDMVEPDPLQVRVKPNYVGTLEQRRVNAAKVGTVLHDYEHPFLDALSAHQGPVEKCDLSSCMETLIQSVVRRMKGFDLNATRDYYRKIVQRAWKEAESIGDVKQREQAIERNFDWMILDPNWGEVWRERRYTYYPTWTRPIIVSSGGGSRGPVGGGSRGIGGGGEASPTVDPSLGEVAAGFAGWAENSAGKLASAIDPTAISSASVGGILDLSGVDRLTGDVFEALAKSGGGGGGGGGCACACAGCACACACAGGGR